MKKYFVSKCHLEGTGTSCKEKFRKENFLNGFLVAWGGFLSYWNNQLIKFEQVRDSDFKHNFVIMKKKR